MIKTIIITIIVLFLIERYIAKKNTKKNTKYILTKYEMKDQFFDLNSETVEYNMYLEKIVFGEKVETVISVMVINENSIREHKERWDEMIKNKKQFTKS